MSITIELTHTAIVVCPICHQDAGVVLSTTIENNELKKIFDHKHYVDPSLVCPDCREKYLQKGIMLINPDTLNLVVIKLDAYMRLFPNQVVTDDHIVFAEDKLIKIS